MRATTKTLALLGLSLSMAFGGTAWAQKKEVLFYSSLTTPGQKALVEQVEKAFPGLKITWIRAGGVGLYQRFVSERLAGKGKIDILHTSYTPGWYHLAKEGWVVPGVSAGPEADKFPAWAKDGRAHFVSLRVPTLQVIYNPDKVKPEEVPKSWAEFTTPKWRGRLVMVDPFESAGVWDFFYGSKAFGEGYIVGLLRNRPLIQRAMGSATERVSTGEREVSFIFEYIALERMRKGEKIKFATMREGVPVIPAPVGIIRGGPNPELAREVFNFMISKEGQRVMSQNVLTYSGRPDVPPPPGLPPLSEVKLIHSDWDKVFREQDRYRDLITRNMRR